MSYGPLPKRVDPRKLAEREVRLQGRIAVSELNELPALLCSDSGEVEVDLQFSCDQQRYRVISGSASASVEMTCQRCLDPVGVELSATFNLAVALTEEHVKQMPRCYDALLLEEEEVELLPMVEEELILNLPIVAYHDDCSVQTSFGDADTAEEEVEDKPNPFSVLAQLKTKPDADKS